MKSYSLLRLYVWLVDTILQHGPITLEDINKQWIRTKLSDGIEKVLEPEDFREKIKEEHLKAAKRYEK